MVRRQSETRLARTFEFSPIVFEPARFSCCCRGLFPSPISAIVLHAGVANVDTVIVGGDIVKQNGKLTHRDLPQRLAELERSSKRLYEGFATDASAA